MAALRSAAAWCPAEVPAGGYPARNEVPGVFLPHPPRSRSSLDWRVTDLESVGSGPDSGSDSENGEPEAFGDEEVAKSQARKRKGKEFFEHLLPLPALGNLAARQRFAQLPLHSGTLRGRVEVLRAGGLKRPRYGLYVCHPGSEEILLIAAERQTQRTLGPYYVLSSNDLDFDRASPCFLGRLSGNVMCTQYLLHGQRATGPLREELAALRFRKPSDAPRSLHVVLPGAAASFSSRSGQEGQLLAAAEGTMPRHQFHYFVNSAPTWDSTRRVYRMNFHNRVHRSSSKNFQLLKADSRFQAESPELVMQFGRIDDAFAFDAANPLSPLQAFAIALSVFDDRVYEALRIYY
ncbi:unnamed protein product [Effrenium voratum]|uniref:Tubby C-terminal domain-containing protein n=1 Tax=Effrenium voratum TaxID=2562239 RepID=A0AA36NI87_9DINO|nr:unnamed protein product [Effrenium voratum]CAJ1408217.1 unnamed protein product [Effrenium voratum]CAJ1455469.1 unnamed protein product [Effrenium voratum]